MPDTTFIGLPAADLTALEAPSAVVIGASEASPYVLGEASHSADAPAALRAASAQFAKSLVQYDFDIDQTFFPAKGEYRGMVDAGDVKTTTFEPEANRAAITAAVEAIVRAGAVPIVLGGDDSVPIPVIAGLAAAGPLTILQIDAHVDWADVIQGNALGYGSPMRRVAEMDHVTGMVQVGIRGLGSGESWQHDDARGWGSRLITSYELHRHGPEAALSHIAPGARVFVSIDCDGIDPAVLPAVNMPTPGGLTYEDVIGLVRGVAAKAEIAGMICAEYVPARDDRHMLSGLIAARITAAIMGLAVAQREARGAR